MAKAWNLTTIKAVAGELMVEPHPNWNPPMVPPCDVIGEYCRLLEARKGKRGKRRA